MRLTKKLVKELHTELWLWLAENPKRDKLDWPQWKFNGGDIASIRGSCFPCEYTTQGRNRVCCCLDFSGVITDGCLGGLFDQWEKAKGKQRSAIAKQIAELSIRKRR